MVNNLLVSLVNSVLGSGRNTARGNRAYHCPFCHHHKPKLEINFTENKKGNNPWHCWVCNKKGKTLISLFKQNSAPHDKILELKELVKVDPTKEWAEVKRETVKLPEEFKQLQNLKKSNLAGRHALAYLKRRGITSDDILKYNIGYCEEGQYKGMIIIPSYDGDGQLNYFVARNFDRSSPIKYKNPPISRNIIPFELFINWSSPLILCEGMFDAIAIKRNAIPLLGKNIQSSLMKKIVLSTVEKIYIALDKDAIKSALGYCETFLNEGKEVYLVELEDKDPSELGFNHFTHLIQSTSPLSFSDLLEKKIQLI